MIYISAAEGQGAGMIKYRLSCDKGHSFESWFSSSGDYDRLEKAGHLGCAVCGSDAVRKALMTPSVSTDRPATRGGAATGGAADAPQAEACPPSPLSQPLSPAEQAMRALREKVETMSEDVGTRFAHEARAMHAGETAERPIRGQARPAEARALIEEGVPIVPLPWKTGPRN